jgi:hypothetical protein
MADYCTLSEVIADLPESGLGASNTEYDGVIRRMITDASRLIDLYLGKWPNYFYPSTDATTRYYMGGNNPRLRIDDAVSISAVAVSEAGSLSSSDYTAWAATDYYTEPYNNDALGLPIRALVIDRENGNQTTWWGYPKGVRVTGIFGWSATPPTDIKRACKIQAVRWFMKSKNAYADSGANAATGPLVFSDQLDKEVQALLRRYMLETLE